MAQGYAQNSKKTHIDELPGSKVINSAHGEWNVADCHYVNQNTEKSAGQTVISRWGTPLWIMSYGGRYAKVAIPFLKECLRKAYVDEERFYGGRGPRFMRGKRFTYFNHIARDSFADFAGEEFIYDLNGGCVGSHWYHGMALIDRLKLGLSHWGGRYYSP